MSPVTAPVGYGSLDPLGWLVKLKDVDVKEYEELMSSSEYRQFLEETV